MRVTKLIREYVEKTITAKMPYGEPTTQYKAAREHMNTLYENLNEQLRDVAKELVVIANSELPEGFRLSVQCGNLISMTDYHAPLREAAATHEQAVREKRKTAIETILVELELGATKADLERLIAEALEK
jgi:hypothetical protein